MRRVNVNARDLITLFIPPIVRSAIQAIYIILKGRRAIEWEYMPEGWATIDSDPAIKGWNVSTILDQYKSKWPQFLNSLDENRPFGVSPEAVDQSQFDLTAHNIMMIYGYALALASRQKDTITMLDWGGGIGHYYLISKTLIPNLNIKYYCKDMSILAEHGQTLFPEAYFYDNESCLNQKYDFVLASGSLQYSRDWKNTLSCLAASTSGFFLLTNIPTVLHTSSFVFVQRPYQYGYNTEYLGWCLNRRELLECAEAAGMTLIREMIIGNRPPIYKAPEQNEYRGFLFSASKS